jgi:hypothetical protein
MNLFVAKRSPGASGDIVWPVAGDAGAVEVENGLAHELVRCFPHDFYFTTAPAVEVAPVVKKAAVKAVPAEPKVEDDLNEAMNVASPTKRRTTKE